MLGKPSTAYFAAALEALDADPELTWMVGDDLEGDIARRAHARDEDDPRAHRQVPARRGRALAASSPTASSRRSRSCRTGSKQTSERVRVGVDLIEIERIRRALERHGDGFKERCFTEAERAYCDSKPNPPQHYAGRFAAKEAVGKALGSGVYFTWKEIEIRGRPKPGVHLSGRTAAWAREGRRGHDRALDDALARARGRRRVVVAAA